MKPGCRQYSVTLRNRKFSGNSSLQLFKNYIPNSSSVFGVSWFLISPDCVYLSLFSQQRAQSSACSWPYHGCPETMASVRFSFLLCFVYFKNFWSHHAACRILVPQPGIVTGPSAVKVWSPNHHRICREMVSQKWQQRHCQRPSSSLSSHMSMWKAYSVNVFCSCGCPFPHTLGARVGLHICLPLLSFTLSCLPRC